METVNLNLAYRWFISYDLDEPVPDFSNLSKIRERYGLEAFLLFFEHITALFQANHVTRIVGCNNYSESAE